MIKKAGRWLVNRLWGMSLSLLLIIVATELFWYNSTPEQRRYWLEISPRPWLADYLELQQSQFITPQLLELILTPPSVTATSEAVTERDTINTSAASNPVHNRLIPSNVNHKQPETAEENPDKHAFANRTFVNTGWHPSSQCVKPPTQKITDVKPQSIYRWTDENGRVHFGERSQSDNAHNLSKTYGRQTQGIKLTLEFQGWQGNSQLESELHKEASLLYRILTRYIPKAQWRQINLNLVIFRNQAAFEAYKQQQQANAGWVAYYDGRRNQAFLAVQPNHQTTMRIARHEMTHAMMLGMLGSTPIWISEGVAQYLEQLSWQLSSAQIEADQYAFEQLSADAAPYQFKTMVGMSHRQFNGENQQQNYTQSAAMMHFLLGHKAGQQWLRKTLGYFAQNPCGAYDAPRFFAQAYPGGLAAAAQGYQQWLSGAEFRTHYY